VSVSSLGRSSIDRSVSRRNGGIGTLTPQNQKPNQQTNTTGELKGGSSVVAVGGRSDPSVAAAAVTAGAGAAGAGPASQAAAAAAGATTAPAIDPAAPARGAGGAAPVASAAPAADDAADDDDGSGPGTPLEMQRERSSWLPGWMRGLLPEGLGGGGGSGGGGGGGRRRQQRQQQPSADANSTSTAADDDSEDARYANLEKYRDLSLEAFLQHQAEQSDDAPPPPRPTPNRRVPPLSPVRRAYQSDESRRVLYYRARHHVRIVEALRDDERARVEADPRSAAAAERLLRSVSARTGYSPGQVADCLRAYESLRFRVNALCDWRAAGRRMPSTQAELAAVVDAAKRQRDGVDLQVLLAERRTPGEGKCPLRRGQLSALGGRRAVCPQTRLPYGECCGALEEEEQGRRSSRAAVARF
jgi:hypothetical protein